MLAIIAGCALASLTLTAPPPTRAAGSPIPAAPAVARALAVVIVNRTDLGDKHFTSTGFVVGSDSKHSYLLTAYHVLCDADEENCLTKASTIPGLRCSAATLGNASADQVVTVLLHTDPTTRSAACVENFGSLDNGNDLLLLRIDRPNLPHLSIARTVMAGWPVAAAGYAAGILEQMHDQPGPPELPPGTVTWIDTDDPSSQAPRQLRDGVETSEGDSGGPLFDMNMGAVVGVVRGQSTVNGRLENAFIAVGPGSIIQICDLPSVHSLIEVVNLNLTPSPGPVGVAQAPSAAGASASHSAALQSAQSSLVMPQAPQSIGPQFTLGSGSDP
ncbi:MAG TPA: serine protease, partial [Vicinamibacterales bacterium]